MTRLGSAPLKLIGRSVALIVLGATLGLSQDVFAQNTQCSMVCNGTDNACYRSCAGPAYEPRPSAPGAPGRRGGGGPAYGSLALSDSSGASGSSWRHPSVARADAVALRYCNQRAPAKDCRIVGRAEGGCVALALETPAIWGGATRATRAEAEAVAKAKCRQEGGRVCSVQTSFCN